MAQEPVINIWPGSGSFFPGRTPFGYFDTDAQFILDIDKFAIWAGRRLGYPITDIELTDDNFYAAYEQSVADYSSYVNSFSARDNILSLSGLPTASLQLEEQYIEPTLQGVFKLSEAYATEIGIGGELKHYTGSINVVANQQVYELDGGTVNLERGNFQTDSFTIRQIFINDASPMARYIDPSGMSGIGNAEFLNQFGWGNMGVQYTLMPLHYDLMRMQALEMHTHIRKAAHGFHPEGNRIRIFPIPEDDSKIFFTYTLDSDSIVSATEGSGLGVITDHSNIPYNNKTYSYINDIGKNWIRRYGLALAKEMLGFVRSKYSSIPMTMDNEVTLNGADLISSAATDIETLITELNETLEGFSRQAQLERKQAETDALSTAMAKLPLKIYVK